MAEHEKETPKVDIEVGDYVKATSGKFKGKKAKVIAVYTNSVAVEFDKKEKDGTLVRTVFSHKEYKKEN